MPLRFAGKHAGNGYRPNAPSIRLQVSSLRAAGLRDSARNVRGIQLAMTAPDPLIAQLLTLLNGGNAHATLADALDGFPAALRATVPDRLPYSAWQLVEHLRITQRDILDFSAPPAGGYRALDWPKDYWPGAAAPPSPESWDRSLAAIAADRESFAALLQQPGVDLYTPFPWGDGQNLLREALLIADHNSYHTGELIVLQRLLGIWPRE